MPQTTIAADVHQPLDIHVDFPAEVAFDHHFLLDNVPEARNLIVGEISYPRIGTDPRTLQHLLARGEPDAVDVGQADFNTLFRGRSTPAIRAMLVSFSSILAAAYASGWYK